MLETGRARGRGRLGPPSFTPKAFASSGDVKSSSSLLSRMPVSPATMLAPNGTVHRGRERHDVALGVGDDEVARALLLRLEVGRRRASWSASIRARAGRELRGIERGLEGRVDVGIEVGIAREARAIRERAAHHLGDRVQVRARPEAQRHERRRRDSRRTS